MGSIPVGSANEIFMKTVNEFLENFTECCLCLRWSKMSGSRSRQRQPYVAAFALRLWDSGLEPKNAPAGRWAFFGG